MPSINFTTTPFTIGSWTILRLPKDASAKLPSRGMNFVEGTLNGVDFKTPLEPDGKGSHWLRLEKIPREPVKLEIESMKDWPNPDVPSDIKKGIAAVPAAEKMWKEITPMARWDWIRWIRSTNNLETRAKRIRVACSKMKSGERRPCCFNRSMCTEPAVSKGEVLLEPM